MEEIEHSLVSQQLKSSGSVTRVANINSQNTSSPYSGLSRSYSSSGSSHHHDRDGKTDTVNFLDKDTLIHGECNNDLSDYVDSILTKRFGRRREARSSRTLGDASNQQRSHGKSDGMVQGGVGIMRKTVFEEEFPLLGAEDKYGSSELGRVLSSSSSTYSNTLLTGNSSLIVSNDLNSASDEFPMIVGSSNIASISSIAPGATGLSMAETLAQGPTRCHTPPQLSCDTQKLEELALKQSRLLIPITPSTPRSMVASPLEKSKLKTGQQQYPLSYSQRPIHSPHGAPVNLDMQKTSAGNFHNVGTSRALNGVSLSAKDDLSPSRSRVSSSSSFTPSAWITLEKRPTSQPQSRSDFFKNLSKKSSLKSPYSDVCPNGMSCALGKSESDTWNAPCSVNSLAESSCMITKNDSAANEPLRFSSNGEQQYSINSVLHPEEEEIAFLRSLGWEESAGEEEGLTEEEIRDFYEKNTKLQRSSSAL